MDSLKKTLATIPHSPGVYLYFDSHNTVIYVGKAKDLYNRVQQYSTSPSHLSEKTRQLVQAIHEIKTLPVATEFEALLLEAKLIRTYSPKYNSIAKDDKSPIYIHISHASAIPYVTLSRKPKDKSTDQEHEYFGPFASTKIARTLLKTLRHSIPFCQQKIRNAKPCFYTHLGLCKPCPSEIAGMAERNMKKAAIAQYAMNIRRLRWVLSGQSKHAVTSLQRTMETLSKAQKFEEAGILRDQIHALVTTIHNRYDPFVFEETDMLEKAPAHQNEELYRVLRAYIPNIQLLHRIECFDISTIHGSSSTGSMVVFEDGIPHTDQYRRFKIRTQSDVSDVGMMEEMIQRRLSHQEWKEPELIIVDGGKPQVSRISALIQRTNNTIPVIGLSKRFENIVLQNASGFHTITLELSNPALQLLQHIRDEAHRCAITYHKKLRSGAHFH